MLNEDLVLEEVSNKLPYVEQVYCDLLCEHDKRQSELYEKYVEAEKKPIFWRIRYVINALYCLCIMAPETENHHLTKKDSDLIWKMLCSDCEQWIEMALRH